MDFYFQIQLSLLIYPMDLKKRLQNAVDFMESYLKEAISMKDIAERAFSPSIIFRGFLNPSAVIP